MASILATLRAMISLTHFVHSIENAHIIDFGFSSANFESATILAKDSLAALEHEQGEGDSVIVLNFRALQAQRIKELQAELVELSMAKLAGGQPEDERKTLNSTIDLLIDRYGINSIQYILRLLLLTMRLPKSEINPELRGPVPRVYSIPS